MNFLIDLYVFLFARKYFSSLNNFIYKLGLRGLGVLNGGKLSGELNMIKKISKIYHIETLFDVGANKGDFSEDFLKKNKNLKIFAFEPHPITYQALKNRFQNFNNITCINKGASDLTHKTIFYDYKHAQGSTHASLYENVLKDIHNGESISYEIDVTTIDDFLEQNNIEKIDFLKIDVEGHELAVIKGSKNAIKNNKIDIIYFEFNEMNVISRVFLRDIFYQLEHYNFYRLLPNGFLLLNPEYKPIYTEFFGYQNIIAIRKDVDLLSRPKQ